MQQDFLLDTRIINEGIDKFNKDVRRFGKLLRSIVKFVVAFFSFALLNICIDLFTKHTHLLSVNNFRLLQEGLRVFINQNLVTFTSIIAERDLFAAMVMAFACLFGAAVISRAFITANSDANGNNEVKDYKQVKNDCKTVSCTVSYKQKVCFLS